MLDGNSHHRAEIVVILAADRNIPGIDAVLVERFSGCRIFREQDVAVVVEVTDNRRVPSLGTDSTNDCRNSLRRFCGVHCDAY